jgi:peroxiredoxin
MHWPLERAVALRQFGRLLAAAACLVTAFVLVAATGLPERAAFTGQLLADDLLVAPEINAMAPPFTATTLSGQSLKLLDLRGAPVLINFWATWCEPCRVEMPELQTIYDQYRERGFRLVAVNLGEPPAAVRQWAQKLGLTFDLVLDERGDIAAQYHLRGQPSTYILSPAGTITHIFYGPVTVATLQTALATYFAQPTNSS